MARRRMIDPDFWENEDIGRLTFRQRVLLIGLFSRAADDYGKGRRTPAYLKTEVFRYDDGEQGPEKVTQADILADLEAIITVGKVKLTYYQDGEHLYFRFDNWAEFQRVDHPTPSRIPDPELCAISPRAPLEELPKPSLLGKVSVDQVRSEEISAPAEPPPDISPGERELLLELKQIPGYPLDFAKDLEHLRTLAVDFPTVDLRELIKTYKLWLQKHPLNKKSNPRLQLRNFAKSEVKFQQERGPTKGGKPSGQPAPAVDFSRFQFNG